MPRRIAWLLAVLIVVCEAGLAKDEGAAVDASKESAQSWLALVDAGQYGDSWDQAAAFFQSQITKDKWESALQSVRAPLGAVQSRKLKSASYTTDLPNAPKGEYVVLQYETSFANLKPAIETITPMKEQDGSWRVSGYFIKPAK